MPNILICDDERSICEMLDITLRREGYKVETVNSGEMAKRKLESALYDVVVTDIKMPNINGIEVLKHAHQISPESAVILITAKIFVRDDTLRRVPFIFALPRLSSDSVRPFLYPILKESAL